MLHLVTAGDAESHKECQQDLSSWSLRTHRPNQIRHLLVVNSENLVQYDLTIMDAPKSEGVPCVVFIIPKPQSWRYAFHTLEGKKKILMGNIAKRIVFVTPLFDCDDLRAKADIRGLISQLVTDDTASDKVTFLAPEVPPKKVPPQTVMRSRDGSVLVEDRKLRGTPLTWRRSLRFKSQMEVLQTEVEFEGSRSLPKFNHTKLTSEVSRTIAALAMMNPMFSADAQIHGEVLLIGVGGGCIINYFLALYPNIRITAVDLNPDVLSFARKCFGVKKGPNCSLICTNGLEFVQNPPSDQKYDLVITDVNEFDGLNDQTAPAIMFSTSKYFASANKLLTKTGCLLTNVCCRGFDRFRYNIKLIEGVSGKTFTVKVPGHLNHIVISWPQAPGVLDLCMLKTRISEKDKSNLSELVTTFFQNRDIKEFRPRSR